MSERTRRKLLRAGAAGLAALAGCAGFSPPDGGAGDGGGGGDGGGSGDGGPGHLAWFGEAAVDAEWLFRGGPGWLEGAGGTTDQMVDATTAAGPTARRQVGQYRGWAPGRGDPEVLGEAYVDQWLSVPFRVGGPGPNVTVPADRVETRLGHVGGAWDFCTGDVDVESHAAALEPVAVRTEPVDGGAVHAFPSPGDSPPAYVAKGVTDGAVVRISGPTVADAVAIARGVLETRAGERTRFVESSDLMGRVADLLPAGFAVVGGGYPSDPVVRSHWIDGSTVTTTFVEHLTQSEQASNLAAERTQALAEQYGSVTDRSEGDLWVADVTRPSFGTVG
ncbi:MAG: hypothetical protein ABEJ42_10355 [Halobacteriaceae archaeon]